MWDEFVKHCFRITFVLSMGARKCPCKVIANSRGGGAAVGLKESLMYELEFLARFGDSNLKPSLREVRIS